MTKAAKMNTLKWIALGVSIFGLMGGVAKAYDDHRNTTLNLAKAELKNEIVIAVEEKIKNETDPIKNDLGDIRDSQQSIRLDVKGIMTYLKKNL